MLTENRESERGRDQVGKWNADVSVESLSNENQNKIIKKSSLKINVSIGNLMIHKNNCVLPVYGLPNEFRIPITERERQ